MENEKFTLNEKKIYVAMATAIEVKYYNNTTFITSIVETPRASWHPKRSYCRQLLCSRHPS